MVRNAWYAGPTMLIVALAAMLAGCLSGAPGSVETSAPFEAYRFTDKEAETRRLSEQGAFGMTDTVCLIQCLVGEGSRSIDIAEILPVGVPLRLNVTVEHDEGYPSTAMLRSDGAMVADVHEDWRGNRQSLLTTVYLPEPEATLHVYIYPVFLVAGPDEGEWRMEAETSALVDHLPAAFPVAFEVADPEAPPRFEPADKTVPFLLWDPDDRFLGTFKTTNTSYIESIRTSGKSGEYVVFAPDSDDELRLVADSPGSAPSRLSLLETETIYHDWHTSTLDEGARWSFDLERVPIETGIAMRRQAMSFINYVSAEGALETPGGKTYPYEQNGASGGGGSPEPGLPRELFTLAPDDEGHAPGTYHASFVSNGHGYEATHFIWDYVRP